MENKEEKQIKVQKFIQRLYKVTSDEKIPQIKWSNNGTTLLITDKEDFRRNALSLISHTKEYTAFLRSLHHYNFRKYKHADEKIDEYSHKYFLQGQPELLNKIIRTGDKGKGVSGVVRCLQDEVYELNNKMDLKTDNIYAITEEVVKLRNKVEQQEKTINGLIKILSTVFQKGLADSSLYPTIDGYLDGINEFRDHKQNHLYYQLPENDQKLKQNNLNSKKPEQSFLKSKIISNQGLNFRDKKSPKIKSLLNDNDNSLLINRLENVQTQPLNDTESNKKKFKDNESEENVQNMPYIDPKKFNWKPNDDSDMNNYYF